MHAEQLFQKSPLAHATEPTDPDSVEDRGCYGVVRALRERALMLELRKTDGEITAIPYALIEKIRFTPDDGITLHALGSEIHIKGRNLNLPDGTKVGLYNGLCRHRIAWVQESSHSLLTDPNTVLVESIMC